MNRGARPSAHHPLWRRASHFAALNTIALVCAVGVYMMAARAESMNGWCERTLAFFFAHQHAIVLAAASPLLAWLLVGWGYMRRARRQHRRGAAVEQLPIAP